MLSTLGKKINRRQFEIVFLLFLLFFSQKISFYISCKVSSLETICIKCQSLFSGKNKKKNSINLSSPEFVQIVVKVNKYSGIYTKNVK